MWTSLCKDHPSTRKGVVRGLRSCRWTGSLDEAVALGRSWARPGLIPSDGHSESTQVFHRQTPSVDAGTWNREATCRSCSGVIIGWNPDSFPSWPRLEVGRYPMTKIPKGFPKDLMKSWGLSCVDLFQSHGKSEKSQQSHFRRILFRHEPPALRRAEVTGMQIH